MISGDSKRRNSSILLFSGISEENPTQDIRRQKALGFTCLDIQSGENEGVLSRHYLSGKLFLNNRYTDNLRLELMFPSCWNGKDADSENHRDHVAFPELVMEGECPLSFGTRLPVFYYETIWDHRHRLF
jgi:Domain of unknown function (DUF1996)